MKIQWQVKGAAMMGTCLTGLTLVTNATKHSIFRAVKKMRHALEPLVAPADLSDIGADSADRPVSTT